MTDWQDRLARHLDRRAATDLELPESSQAAIAAVLAPGLEDPERPELLLILRALRAGDPWSGHMALPGGRREGIDPDLAATAQRETREEVGVDLEAARPLGRLDDLHPIRQSRRQLAVRPFVYALSERPALSLNEEVTAAYWISFERLRENEQETSVLHRGSELVVPAYLVEGRAVWGMTQRVLAPLLALALDPDS